MPELQTFGGMEGGTTVSPGGFEFGVQGWTWAHPVVRSITFFIDNTAQVSDQYGRPIKGITLDDGREFFFAPAGPDADKDGRITPRPWLATHAQVVELLARDLRVDVIEEMNQAGQPCGTCKGQGISGGKKCQKCRATGMKQVIACAGWPQLPYEQLMRIKKLPPTPREQLSHIMDMELRRDALKMWDGRVNPMEQEAAG